MPSNSSNKYMYNTCHEHNAVYIQLFYLQTTITTNFVQAQEHTHRYTCLKTLQYILCSAFLLAFTFVSSR
jgi:hypothetical protein